MTYGELIALMRLKTVPGNITGNIFKAGLCTKHN
jgi:hypothetical protein